MGWFLLVFTILATLLRGIVFGEWWMFAVVCSVIVATLFAYLVWLTIKIGTDRE